MKQQDVEDEDKGRNRPEVDVSLTTGPVGEGAQITGLYVNNYYASVEEISHDVRGLPNPYLGLRAFT